MNPADESEPIQLSGDRIVDIDFTMINLTGIPDEEFTQADDVWDNEGPVPANSNGPIATSVPPTIPVPPKSV